MKGAILKKGLKLTGWVLLVVFSLILLTTFAFYLARGLILEKVVSRLNEEQPGEVLIEQMLLVPFLNFPDVSLQLRDVHYFEKAGETDTLKDESILALGELYVSLDVLALIKGDYELTEVSLKNGHVRAKMYPDSVLNLERALGISFRAAEEDSLAADEGGLVLPEYGLNLDRLSLENIHLSWKDQCAGDDIGLHINSLESAFHSIADSVLMRLKLNVDLDEFKYLTYKSEKKRNVQIDTELSVDMLEKKATMDPSSMRFSGLAMEVSGTCDFMDVPYLDIDFRASNEGLDVLNFIFRGILDMDEIEQTDGGRISLEGSLEGALGDARLPALKMDARAENLGFMVRAIEREINDINFRMALHSGEKGDLSDAHLEVKGLTARSPEGIIVTSFTAENAIEPELKLELTGDLQLDGLDQVFEVENLSMLQGHVRVDGRVEGRMDSLKNFSLREGANLKAVLSDVGCRYGKEQISMVNGRIFMEGDSTGLKNFELAYNGDRLSAELKMVHLLQNLLGGRQPLDIGLLFLADTLHPFALTGDSALTETLGDEISDLYLRASLTVAPGGLKLLMDKGEIPPLHLQLDSMGVYVPILPEAASLSMDLELGQDTLNVSALQALLGQSDLHFRGRLLNYRALLEDDSTLLSMKEGGSEPEGDSCKKIALDYALNAGLLRPKDLLTLNDSFLLPPAFEAEQVQDLNLEGSLVLPLSVIRDDSSDLSLQLRLSDLDAGLHYYPNDIRDFRFDLRLEGDDLFIDDLSGHIGESNLMANAEIYSFRDSTMKELHGRLELKSDLLDVDQLKDYRLPGLFPEEDNRAEAAYSASLPEGPESDTTMLVEEAEGLVELSSIDYPEFEFDLDIRELRVSVFDVSGINGRVRSTPEKIFYLDSLTTSGGSGGKIAFNGQFNVSSPTSYNLSAALSISEMDVNDLDIEMTSEEGDYQLRDNFRGVISADGLAEFFLTPDLNLDMGSSTALFNYRIDSGALINFEPLQAASRYLDGKDLSHVRFGTLRNSFPMSLVDGRIVIPLTVVESTAGQLLIEGEQGLDGSYLYLLRIPKGLVKEAVVSVLSNAGDNKEDEIERYKRGKFVMVTVFSDGETQEVKIGDKREKFLE
ncbi:MAG: hypothetical protein CSA96_02025 [Bacteroidetes bacterium]|nr:MAG: hypothetical protein CSA96_02025 [Bacteroidota bacterium]